MNSVSLYSLKSNESNYITDGINKFYIRDNKLIINDGKNEHIIDISTVSSFDPSTTLFIAPAFNTSEIVERNQTLIQCLTNIVNSVMTIAYYEEHKGELKGDKGNDGPQGEQGPKGPDGLSAFEHFQKQTYDNIIYDDNIPPESIDEYNRRYDEYMLTIKGPKGDTGDIGPQGPQGPKGDTGLQGPQGEEGKQANSWIWAMIGAGVSVASVATMQSQIGTLLAANEAQQAVNTTVNTTTNIANAAHNLGNALSRSFRNARNGIMQAFHGIRRDGYRLIDLD